MSADTTLDGLLNKRITVEQPAKGFRIAVDTVLLAAAVPALPFESAVEFGCGVGGAMLCLAVRVPDLRITGIETQPDYATLAHTNIARNNLADRLNVLTRDVTQMAFDASTDHVFMNPPYHDTATHDVSADQGKRAANSHDGDTGIWIAKAADALKPQGILTLIHRADQLAVLRVTLDKHFNAIEVLPLLPKENEPPKRIILRARKHHEAGFRLCKPLVLHKAEGGYTDAAESILRHAKAMAFD